MKILFYIPPILSVYSTFPTMNYSNYHEKIPSVPVRLQPFENDTSPLTFERTFFKDKSFFNRNRSVHGKINEWSIKY